MALSPLQGQGGKEDEEGPYLWWERDQKSVSLWMPREATLKMVENGQ